MAKGEAKPNMPLELSDELFLWHLASKHKLFKARELQKAYGELGQGHVKMLIDGVRSELSPATLMNDWDEYLSMADVGVRILRIIDQGYPSNLRSLDGEIYPPPILYCKGVIPRHGKCVAVVGTRRYSRKGMEMAYDIGHRLALQGFTVINGLARGIDTYALRGALDGGGMCVAVLPLMESVYPPENASLAEQIQVRGAILSEHYSDREAKFNFKVALFTRNRIISGIADAVVVVESHGSGGATAQIKYALLRHKPVFIMKPVGDMDQHGYELFAEQGARTAQDVTDLLEMISALLG